MSRQVFSANTPRENRYEPGRVATGTAGPSSLPRAARLASRLGGYPDLGAGLALFAWLLLRVTTWRQAKLFEWAAGFYIPPGAAGPGTPPAGSGQPVVALAAEAPGAGFGGRGRPPATLDYARLMTGPEWWTNRHFIRVNRWLTLIWAICF